MIWQMSGSLLRTDLTRGLSPICHAGTNRAPSLWLLLVMQLAPRVVKPTHPIETQIRSALRTFGLSRLNPAHAQLLQKPPELGRDDLSVELPEVICIDIEPLRNGTREDLLECRFAGADVLDRNDAS